MARNEIGVQARWCKNKSWTQRGASKYAPLLHALKVIQLFSYIQYSQAQIEWSWEYGLVFFIGLLIFIGLWIGYRNNEIEDQKRKRLKVATDNAKKARLERLDALYPNKK